MSTGDVDGRTRPQLMADLFTERLTGQSVTRGTPVEVQLLMPTHQMFGDQPGPAPTTAHPAFGIGVGPLAGDHADGPSWLADYGPIPAAIARGIIAGIPDLRPPPAVLDQAQAWLRRVFFDPATGHVTDIDSRRRAFDGTIRRFITIRDQVCRTPGCDAPIRDIDHVQRHRDDGTTSATNGIGVPAIQPAQGDPWLVDANGARHRSSGRSPAHDQDHHADGQDLLLDCAATPRRSGHRAQRKRRRRAAGSCIRPALVRCMIRTS